MIQRTRGGVVGFLVLSSCAGALAFAGGCSSDDPVDPSPAGDSSVPILHDSSTQQDSSDPIVDAAADAVDAAEEAAAASGCAAHPTAAFCDDFDSPDALTAGKTKWDFVEPSAQPVLTLSSARSVSAPSSLLAQIIDGTSPGAKFAKTITKAGFTEATWDYDVYLDNVGGSDGFFLDDFQFTDDRGGDNFGFRLVIFAKPAGAGFDFIRVEHNAGAIGGEYAIEGNVPDGVVTTGKWHHFTQNVKLKFASADAGADAGDGGASTATYTLTVDGAATPTFTKVYAGISRAQATFARFAGMPLVFNKANSAGLKIYWDNHVTDLK
ncbi:MAG: hypothetical protein JWP97_5432 [Labilithrix sp.]|nr:hypothetical protein [Labilithrix sp.]